MLNVSSDLIHSKGHYPDVGEAPSTTMRIADFDLPTSFCACTVTTTWLEKPEEENSVEDKDCGIHLDCNDEMLSYCQIKIHAKEVALSKLNPEESVMHKINEPGQALVSEFPAQKMEKAVHCVVAEP